MAHDFAKKKSPNTKPKQKKVAAPAWNSLFTGFVLGIFVSGLIYLSGSLPVIPGQNAAANLGPKVSSGPKAISGIAKRAAAKPQKTQANATDRPHFDFYTILPANEIRVNVEPVKDAPAEEFAFLLQAGSFQQYKDADSLRAKLILMGLETNIETAKLIGGHTWHRVQVGPFYDRKNLVAAELDLASLNIESILLKLKSEPNKTR